MQQRFILGERRGRYNFFSVLYPSSRFFDVWHNRTETKADRARALNNEGQKQQIDSSRVHESENEYIKVCASSIQWNSGKIFVMIHGSRSKMLDSLLLIRIHICGNHLCFYAGCLLQIISIQTPKHRILNTKHHHQHHNLMNRKREKKKITELFYRISNSFVQMFEIMVFVRWIYCVVLLCVYAI